jgi:hypothetical protein
MICKNGFQGLTVESLRALTPKFRTKSHIAICVLYFLAPKIHEYADNGERYFKKLWS